MSVVITKRGTPQKVLPHHSEPLKTYSLKLPASAQRFLDALSQEASDHLGWTVSSSTLLRVMLQYIKQQSPSWVAKSLYPLIEQEIAQGRVWGTKRKTVLRGNFDSQTTPHTLEPGKLGRVGKVKKQKGKRT